LEDQGDDGGGQHADRHSGGARQGKVEDGVGMLDHTRGDHRDGEAGQHCSIGAKI